MTNYYEYKNEARNWSNATLQSQYNNLTRMTGASYGSGTAGLALAPFTFGLSLIGTGLGGYGMRKAHKKQKMLEELAEERGISLDFRTRDVLGGTAFGCTLGAVTHGVAGHVVGAGVVHATSHVALATTSNGMTVLTQTAGNTTAAHLAGQGADYAVRKGVGHVQQRGSGCGTEMLEKCDSAADSKSRWPCCGHRN